MKRCLQLLAALSGVLMCAAGATQALASSTGFLVATSANQSDSSLRWARQRLEQNIDMLQRDRHDYGGYRVHAIESFQDARTQLSLALRYDTGRETAASAIASSRPQTNMSSVPGDCASDVNLNAVRRNVEQIMDVLQRDNHDYGGHRVAALQRLAQGRKQIQHAIAWDNTH